MDTEVRNKRVLREKVKPETITELELAIANQRGLIERLKVVTENLKDNIGWKALVQTQSEKLEGINDELDNYETLSDKGRDRLLCERLMTKDLIDLLPDYERQILLYTEGLNENMASLNEKKQRMRVG